MSERLLVLRFDAPLQSWGVAGKGLVRGTLPQPTFSGVVGLIANAQGRGRCDPLDDLAELTFASRTDRSGQLTRDFFTAGTVTGIAYRDEENDRNGDRHYVDKVKDAGVVGTKFYLAGAAFTVVLGGDQKVLDAAADALRHPARALYLGRRSCPLTRPPFEAVVEGDSAEQVLRNYPLDDALIPPTDGSDTWKLRGRTRDLYADPQLRLSLPASPSDPGAVLRQDIPVDFGDPHRPYLGRYVRTVYIDRESVYPILSEVKKR